MLRCVKASGSVQLLPRQGLSLALNTSRGPVDQKAALGRVSRQMIPRCDRRFRATPWADQQSSTCSLGQSLIQLMAKSQHHWRKHKTSGRQLIFNPCDFLPRVLRGWHLNAESRSVVFKMLSLNSRCRCASYDGQRETLPPSKYKGTLAESDGAAVYSCCL